MKKQLQLIAFLACFFAVLFSRAQVPNYQILGPHTEYEGPYYIRIFVNFHQTPTAKWTETVDLAQRAAGILAKLNSAYNEYHIYFVGADSTFCAPPYQVITEQNFQASHLHSSSPLVALDVFDQGDSGAPSGYGFDVPNTFCTVSGSDSIGPASQSEVLVHEVGHCLGLSHIFTDVSDGGCLETVTGCANSDPACYCCGDYVCDTPISPYSITANSDCSASVSPQGLVPEAFRNYMSYTTPGRCRDLFTEGQVKRMWAYLALAPALQDIQLSKISYPAVSPGSISGDIVVDSSELVIDTPLVMLPGASIWVKPGAKLRVSSTISGACDQMWQGIVVEGTTFDLTQSTAYQGQVVVTGLGKIEHARVGIDVQAIDLNGAPIGSTGGGIVTVTGGHFENNTIGMRFGPFTGVANGGGSAANKSRLLSPYFSVTDDYRGGTRRPTFLDLNGVVRLNIQAGHFQDQRSECDGFDSRAIGIDAKNASFAAFLTSVFENLYYGIRADKLHELNGSFSAYDCAFSACYRAVASYSNSSFLIRNNDITVKKPGACSSTPADEIKGVEIGGNTTGFTFSKNYFTYDGEDWPYEVLIGTDCANLKAGLGNIVFDNTYYKLSVGNRAAGDNGYDPEGLLYICNTNQLAFPADFWITSGNIRKTQGVKGFGNLSPIGATGNIFSGDSSEVYTFRNLGAEIDYYFYNGDPAQDPGTPDSTDYFPPEGINPKEVSTPNTDCAESEPCLPPCPEAGEMDNHKNEFRQNLELWLEKTANLSSITDTTERRVEEDAVGRLRLAMNRDGSWVLMNYCLDTVAILTDSVLAWLSLVETYPTDLRLASHYFFTGDSTAFDQLWTQIPAKYDLEAGKEDEFERLGDVFGALRPCFQNENDLYHLPDSVIAQLKNWSLLCDEPGFLASAILWRNEIDALPPCHSAMERPGKTSATAHPTLAGNSIRIYPNPAAEWITLAYPVAAQQQTLQVFDLRGRLLCAINLPAFSSEARVPTAQFIDGLYLIRIRSDKNEVNYSKFIISH